MVLKYIKVYLLPFLILFIPFCSYGAIQIPMDEVSWLYKGNGLQCKLINDNASYGKFYFRSVEKNKVNFIVSLNKKDVEILSGLLGKKSAPWKKHSENSLMLNSKPDKNGDYWFSDGVMGLLSDIESGDWIEFSLGGSNSSAGRNYIIPTVRIYKALKQFRLCQSKLPEMSYQQAKKVVLLFKPGQTRLETKQINKLSALFSYVEADSGVKKILIDGHTDNVGSRLDNLVVSRRRAELVDDQLVMLGVTPAMTETRWHGDRYPRAGNTTESGQAKNRRVTIRLLRTDEKVVPVKAIYKDKKGFNNG